MSGVDCSDVDQVLVLDYDPDVRLREFGQLPYDERACQRCGWKPAVYRPGNRMNDLWSAVCVRPDTDTSDMAKAELVWQVLCGAYRDVDPVDGSTVRGGNGCLDQLQRVSLFTLGGAK